MKRYYLIGIILLLSVGLIIIKIWGKLTLADPLKTNVPSFINLPINVRKVTSITIDRQEQEAVIINQGDFERLQPTYFAIQNMGEKATAPGLIINDRDWSSNSQLAKMALQDNQSLSDQEKAIKIFNFVANNVVHSLPPLYNSENELSNPVFLFNALGYGFCSNSAYALAILIDQVGLTARVVYLNDPASPRAHVVTEVFFNNSWHMFDADRGAYYKKENGEIASVQDILSNSSLIDPHVVLKYGDLLLQLATFKDGKIVAVETQDSYNKKILQENFSYTLQPGEEIRFYYNWPGGYLQGDLAKQPTVYSNGLLISKIKQKSIASFLRDFTLPYPILAAYIYGKNVCQLAQSKKVFISLGNDNWLNVEANCQGNNILKINTPFSLTTSGQIQHKYSLKFTDQFNDLTVYTQFQVAPKSIPQITEGSNKIKTVKDGRFKLSFAFSDK